MEGEVERCLRHIRKSLECFPLYNDENSDVWLDPTVANRLKAPLQGFAS